ncbi:MAG: transporter substrate-binding domain-containing protein [Casimicrobiaceae bacterium]
MNGLKSWLTGAIAGVAVVASLAAPVAAARTLDEIMASKKLVVGINPTLPPLGVFNDKNQIDGVDVDIARAIAAKMGLNLEIVQVGSPDRIPFVNSGKIDMVMGAMTWTAERAKAIDYTLPVYTEVLGVLTTKAKDWSDWKQLDDPSVRLVQVRGTTPVKFIAEKLPKAQVLLLDNYPDAVRAIAQNRADGMVDVLDFLTEHTKTHKVDWKTVPTPVDVYVCGIGIAKGNDALRVKLNGVIKDLHAEGVIDKAWLKWFGAPMLFDPKKSPLWQQLS